MPVDQRYISSELAHFVGRGLDKNAQYKILLKILKEGWITHPPHDPKIKGSYNIYQGASFSDNKMFNPDMVCFCDIPIADIGLHISKYSPFGLSFEKDFIIQKGGSPVFYIPRQAWVYFDNVEKDQYFDVMVEGLHEYFDKIQLNFPELKKKERAYSYFIYTQLFSYIKFYDQSLPDDHEENFYMEREWRVFDNLNFSFKDIKSIFMPKEYSKRFRKDCPSYESQLLFVS